MYNQNGGINMVKKAVSHISKPSFLIILFLFSLCVEPYEFRIENNEPNIVIESFISSKSYNESLLFPSDGRYFQVKLKYTSDVINIKDEVESNAQILLFDESQTSWQYQEMANERGTYLLLDKDFKALKGIQYQLKVTLSNGEIYESSWEEIPNNAPDEIGEISFVETVEKGFVEEAGEEVIRTFNGVDTYIGLPKHNTSPIYYKWDFEATWMYDATFASSGQKIRTCWINNKLYLSNYVLHKDLVGGYPQELVFIQTNDSHRVFIDFSLLVHQYAMSEDYYFFLKEVQDQAQKGGLFDSPPFNLKTNFKGVNTLKKISGYFGVVDEKTTRWYFNKNELSYNVVDNTSELCNIVYGRGRPGGPECYNCLDYPYGTATNIKPTWWH